MFDATKAYNNLPMLPPAHDVETVSLLKLASKAGASLAYFDCLCSELEDAQMHNIMHLMEAKNSCAIEGITTSMDRLLLAQRGEPTDLATQQVLWCHQALQTACHGLQERPLTSNTALEVCQQLKGVAFDVRNSQVVIKNSRGEVVYVPPNNKTDVLALLANWERFWHAEDDLDVLIKLAILHYQFEAIHPYFDGNGRTGRILNILFLLDKNRIKTPSLCLSHYIVNHQEGYYQGLLHVTKYGDWQAWIAYFLTAVHESSQWGAKQVLAALTSSPR